MAFSRYEFTALAVVNGVSCGLRILGFDKMLRLLTSRQLAVRDHEVNASEAVERVRTALATAKGWHLSATANDCLPVALSALYLLRRQGLAAELMLGVMTHPFQAHAWVRIGDQTIDYPPNKFKTYASVSMKRVQIDS